MDTSQQTAASDTSMVSRGPAKTYTVWSVIATLFFWPTGLVCVFQSGKTYAANQCEQWGLAHTASQQVRKWQNITAVIFVAILVVAMASQATFS
ncbi:MAG: CD225/dispanin family protein [Candidatus Nanopelagicales bacterium]